MQQVKTSPIHTIVRQISPASPEDGLSKIASIMQMGQARLVPITVGGRLAGIVAEEDLLKRLASGCASEIRAADIMRTNAPCVSIYSSVADAADIMNESQSDALPVVDENWVYHGVVTRSDVIAAVMNIARPPSVAGMATPLGVRLTTGGISAGAGSFGLYLAGIAMMLMIEAARLIIWGAVYAADRLFGLNWTAMLSSPPAGVWVSVDIIHYVVVPLQLAIMLLLIRLSPISSYHAAEHQVVHAIEMGEPLTPETVAKLPRAHPRCGTNLMAAAVIFMAIVTSLGGDMGVLVALVVVVLGWRRIGYYLQQYVTTKPPGRKHIENAISAAEELLEKYRQGHWTSNGFLHVWNMGFIQVFMGIATIALIDYYILPMFGIVNWWL
jgi:CBS domain-containing protein